MATSMQIPTKLHPHDHLLQGHVPLEQPTHILEGHIL